MQRGLNCSPFQAQKTQSVEFIAPVTALSPFLVRQYIEMINASDLSKILDPQYCLFNGAVD
jgi:hypothetical protein